jgi:hypothetical protein
MNTDCSICLNAIGALNWRGTLKCGHRYHRGCILTWLHKLPHCPMCRAPVCMSNFHVRKRVFLARKQQEDNEDTFSKEDEYALAFYNSYDPLRRLQAPK